MSVWSEMKLDGTLQDMLYRLLDAENDAVINVTASEIIVHLEDHLDYCSANKIVNNVEQECPAYVAPGCGEYCEEHREMGR